MMTIRWLAYSMILVPGTGGFFAQILLPANQRRPGRLQTTRWRGQILFAAFFLSIFWKFLSQETVWNSGIGE